MEDTLVGVGDDVEDTLVEVGAEVEDTLVEVVDEELELGPEMEMELA